MDIAAGEGIPRTDPYSFTARGTEWVVQSWLPEALYGLADRLGPGWLVTQQAVLIGGVAWLTARLARAGSPLRTLAAAVPVMLISATFWAPRPLVFGALGLALTITIVRDRRHPLWLVPVVWVWVNSHGSFPLGLLWLGTTAAGLWLDGKRGPALRRIAGYIGGFGAGLVVAAINPLGPRLLTFALTVGEKRESFQAIIEWQSPNFQQTSGLVVLAGLTSGLLVLLRRRPPWRDLLPFLALIALGLVAQRNLPMAGIALAPVLGDALRSTGAKPAEGERALGNWLVAGALGVVALAVVASGARGPALSLSNYPVQMVAWMDRERLLERPHRVASQDFVGCYLILRDGRSARVFVDDRVDMYPVELTRDYTKLLAARPGARRILDQRKIDVVLWERDQPLVELLRATGDWREVRRDKRWVVMVRRGGSS